MIMEEGPIGSVNSEHGTWQNRGGQHFWCKRKNLNNDFLQAVILFVLHFILNENIVK